MQLTEQRIREIVREEIAAAATTATIKSRLTINETLRRRIVEMPETNRFPDHRDRALKALDESDCSLQSLLLQL